MTEVEKAYIQACRSLGACLRRYAIDRKDDDKKLIGALHTEIARIHRDEEHLNRQPKAHTT